MPSDHFTSSSSTLKVTTQAGSLVLHEPHSHGVLDVLFFAVKVGTEQKAVFSGRYPLPIFYLIEMTWFDNLFIHFVDSILDGVGRVGADGLAEKTS